MFFIVVTTSRVQAPGLVLARAAGVEAAAGERLEHAAQLVHRPGVERPDRVDDPCWSSRCDLGEPTWFSFISWSVSAIRPAIWSSCRAAGVMNPHHVQEVVRLRLARQDRGLLLDGFERRHELGPLGPLADQDLVEQLVGRDDLELQRRSIGRSGRRWRSGRRPRATNRRIVPDRGRIGLQQHLVPRLVVQRRTAFSAGAADWTVVALRLDRARLVVAEIVVRSICSRSAARPKSSVAPIESGIVATGVTWLPSPRRPAASPAARGPEQPDRQERRPRVQRRSGSR